MTETWSFKELWSRPRTTLSRLHSLFYHSNSTPRVSAPFIPPRVNGQLTTSLLIKSLIKLALHNAVHGTFYIAIINAK